MIIIGIAGGSGSGKTTVVKKIIKSLPQGSVSVISQDAYYRDNGHLPEEEKRRINFDHPSSIEFNLLIEHLDQLKHGESIGMPVYSYVTCARSSETITIHPTKVIIVDGILILTNPRLRRKLDIKVFVDAEPDDRLIRIIWRDIAERNRNLQQVLEHYEHFVKPMHLLFIEPNKRYADIIIPQGGKNQIAVDILKATIREKLLEDE